MDFSYSPKVQELIEKLNVFMEENVYPNEALYEQQLNAQESRWSAIPPIMESLKNKAKEAGLWNLFLPESDYGAGLTNVEYAPLCEIMGRSMIAPEIFNCNAPDTGNMEVLARYGTEQQKNAWLKPLLEGEIRSCFSMTEPDAPLLMPQISKRGLKSRVLSMSLMDGNGGPPAQAILDAELRLLWEKPIQPPAAMAAIDDPRSAGYSGSENREDASGIRL